MRNRLIIIPFIATILFMVANSLSADNVGSPKATLSVNGTGASVYSLEFEVPSGGFDPHVAISYSSQSQNCGMLGYGFNISGISVITSAPKDKLHNGITLGATYLSDSNYFIDGKCLLLQSGVQGADGSTYTLEGDPYTNVTIHGGFTSSSVNQWFEVKTADGITYQYGNSSDSRLTFTSKGLARCAAWYISKAEDKYANYITYTYSKEDLYIYPLCITYGQNAFRNRGITNTINFSYSHVYTSLPNYFWLLDQRGQVGRVLNSVSTKSDSSTYREYRFTYNNSSDNSARNFNRLSSVQVFNQSGEHFNPIVFDWSHVSSPSISVRTKQVETKKFRDHLESEGAGAFMSVDMTGNGIADIIRMNGEQYQGMHYTGVSISKSFYDSSTGEISYSSPLYYYLTPIIDSDLIKCMKSIIGATSLMDFDGDGLYDILFPHYIRTSHGSCYNFQIIYGCNVKDAEWVGLEVKDFSINLLSDDTEPLTATLDADSDGLDEIICIERKKSNNLYNGKIIHYNDAYGCSNSTSYGRTSSAASGSYIAFSLDSDPKSIFTGDYNNDGLIDIILLTDNGYYIFYNNGGNNISGLFNNTNKSYGTNVYDFLAMKQGDINGDGLTDFVFRKKNDQYIKVAYNNGNGTFSVSNVYNTNRSINDTDTLTLNVYDMNNDGLSDVFLAEKTTSGTSIKWLYSSGNNLVLSSQYSHSGNESNKGYNIMLGDFDGDGAVELGNYGSSLISNTYNVQNGQIFVYKSCTDAASLGKISSITDGFNVRSTITYSSLANPSIYTKGESSYPLNSYTLPLSVVSKIKSEGNLVSPDNMSYAYGDMKIHLGGRGLLGFSNIRKTDNAKRIAETTNIDDWETTYWTPSSVTVTTACGNATSIAQSQYTTLAVGANNWYAYISRKDNTDYDGNTTITERLFNPEYGAITYESVSYGTSMYKTTSCDDFVYTGYNYVPETVINTQKHSDDVYEYTETTKYQYDSKGDAIQIIEQYGKELSLTTNNTYDTYGNILSTQSSGQGISSISKVYTYDNSGRFLVEEHTVPESYANEYTYDIWGHVLTKTDASDSSNELTTSYTYDNWGNLTTETMPDGNATTYTISWRPTGTFHSYVVLKTPTNAPWIKTTYDARGNELLVESVGIGGMLTRVATGYNNGTIDTKVKTKGNQVIIDKYSYDHRGRETRKQTIAGGTITRTTTYEYGNRSVSTTTAGRTLTQTYDAWGNLKTSRDPNNHFVTYTYSSNGNPVRITSNGAVMSLGYDDVGNRTSISDPDAKTVSYTYAAGGRLLSETDGNGVQTTYQYDFLGREISADRGGITEITEYADSEYGKGQIRQKNCNNNGKYYLYDLYGRVSNTFQFVQTDAGMQYFSTEYNYDANGHLSRVDYPGGLSVTYDYDQYGYNTAIYANGNEVYSFISNDGRISTSRYLGSLTSTCTHDTRGVLASHRLSLGNTLLNSINYTFDTETGNLTSRQRQNQETESFIYDNLDRLIGVNIGNTEAMSMTYAANGNITNKTGLGNYTYDSIKKHAVTSVQNDDGSAGSTDLDTEFYAYNNKIRQITDESNEYSLTYIYGPDDKKYRSESSHNTLGNNIVRKVLYAGDYEHVETQYFPNIGCTLPSPILSQDFYFLDGGIIIIKENGEFKAYKAFVDNLGSILAVYDAEGNLVFDADYDAWGKQNVNLNDIELRYGYTGHEMLPEVGLINMEGRLYDPVIARFLSPDNYVQMPDYTQSFNRYSYCINNPLKYTDPSGEVFGVDDFLLGVGISAAFGAAINVWQNKGNISDAGDFFGYLGVGALTGAAGSCVGTLFPGVIPGILGGAFTGGALNAISNGLNNIIRGDSFDKNIFSSFATGALIGGITGGIFGGYQAFKSRLNIWTGEPKHIPVPKYVTEGLSPQQLDLGATLPETKINGFDWKEYSHKSFAENSQLPENWNMMISYEKGEFGVKMHIAYQNLDSYVREVSYKVNSVTYRADLSYFDENGLLHIVEIKTGPKAGLTPNQKITIPQLIQGNNVEIIPFGNKAKTLFKGTLPNKITDFVFDIYWNYQ